MNIWWQQAPQSRPPCWQTHHAQVTFFRSCHCPWTIWCSISMPIASCTEPREQATNFPKTWASFFSSWLYATSQTTVGIPSVMGFIVGGLLKSGLLMAPSTKSMSVEPPRQIWLVPTLNKDWPLESFKLRLKKRGDRISCPNVGHWTINPSEEKSMLQNSLDLWKKRKPTNCTWVFPSLIIQAYYSPITDWQYLLRLP